MGSIVYTKHLLTRIKLRSIAKSTITHILQSPQFVYLDTLNKTTIAVSKVKSIYYMLAYTIKNDTINAITIHPGLVLVDGGIKINLLILSRTH